MLLLCSNVSRRRAKYFCKSFDQFIVRLISFVRFYMFNRTNSYCLDYWNIVWSPYVLQENYEGKSGDATARVAILTQKYVAMQRFCFRKRRKRVWKSNREPCFNWKLRRMKFLFLLLNMDNAFPLTAVILLPRYRTVRVVTFFYFLFNWNSFINKDKIGAS